MGRGMVALLLTLCSVFARADIVESVTTVPTRGTSIAYLLSRDDAATPRTVYVLLSGGYGDHGLMQRGEVAHVFNDQKFLARARRLFVGVDSAAALVDTPADPRRLDDAFRASAQHAADVKAVLDDLARRFGTPRIVLIGHSNGSLSAAHVAKHLGAGVSDIVLVNGRLAKHWYGGDALSGFDFASLPAAVLLVHHARDDCTVTPYAGALALAGRLPLVTIDDAEAGASGGCSGGSHNLVGKDREATRAILHWIRERS